MLRQPDDETDAGCREAGHRRPNASASLLAESYCGRARTARREVAAGHRNLRAIGPDVGLNELITGRAAFENVTFSVADEVFRRRRKLSP